MHGKYNTKNVLTKYGSLAEYIHKYTILHSIMRAISSHNNFLISPDEPIARRKPGMDVRFHFHTV